MGKRKLKISLYRIRKTKELRMILHIKVYLIILMLGSHQFKA